MHLSTYLYYHGEQELHGFLAYKEPNNQPKPAVIVAHDWSGRNDFACDVAKHLAELGYIGFAADQYGLGRIGTTLDEKKAFMTPLINNRTFLYERMRAALDTVSAMPEVDATRIAAIGFCFGGLCVLDLARFGAELRGVVSFHGLLNKPNDYKAQNIQAKILALHGYDDPMGPPEELNAFCQEMTAAKADWRVYQYGNSQHGFTNPKADDHKAGIVYNPLTAKRSWAAMTQFLDEIFVL